MICGSKYFYFSEEIIIELSSETNDEGNKKRVQINEGKKNRLMLLKNKAEKD
jgi:hypothetical protein